MSGAAYIGLGTNLAFGGVEGPELLVQAVAALRNAGLEVRALSGIWKSPAWPPGSGQPDFHNAVAELDAGQATPQQLYASLRAVETSFGRVRRERWGPRTLDLDILDMGGCVGSFRGVELPHPRLHERAFVLAPLAEIAPAWRHPVSGEGIDALLAAAGGMVARVERPR